VLLNATKVFGLLDEFEEYCLVKRDVAHVAEVKYSW